MNEEILVGGSVRNVAIDSLRGIAIILMVMGHVIGNVSSAGMQVADESGWRYFYLLLEDVRMPLFTALSGLVYGMRPLSAFTGYGRLVKGKVRRLLVPLITVGLTYHAVHSLTPGTNADSSLADGWKVLVYGGGYHFWFLQSVFLIFVVVGIADGFGWFRQQSNLVIAIALSSLLSLVFKVPEVWDIFSVNNAVRLLPFFLLGYFASKLPGEGEPKPRTGYILSGLVGVLFTARAFEIFGLIDLGESSSKALSVALGIVAIALVITYRNRMRVPALARLGYFSFSIYLLHIFGTAPARILLMKLGVANEFIIFAACLFVGLLLPILFEVTLGRVAWISWTFLGQRPFGSSRTASA